MKTVLKKWIIIVITILISIVILNLILQLPSEHTYKVITDKHSYLEDAEKNKIILVGGSNLAYGMDSSSIESRFDYDVVNMGLNAGIGLRFMLNDIKPYLKNGDIVVICPEYEQFTKSFNGDVGLGSAFLQAPYIIKRMSSENMIQVIKTYPQTLRTNIAILIKSIIGDIGIDKRSNYNSDGDLIGHLDEVARHIEVNQGSLGELYKEVFTFLKKYNQEMSDLGVKVYMSWPSIVAEKYNQYYKDVKEIEESIRNISGITIISKSEDYTYEIGEMFDTVYHLNKEGRRKRTEQLIKDLEAVLY